MPPGILSRSTLARSWGRSTGPQFLTTIPFTGAVGGQKLIPQVPISLDLPLIGLWINLNYRFAVTVANMGAVAAEAPGTLLQNLRIFGQYKRGAQTPWDISGATLFALARAFNIVGNDVYINGVLQAEPGIPFAQTLANFGNVANYDVDQWYFVPTAPLLGKSSRTGFAQRYFWRSADWGNTLQMQLQIGDQTSFGTMGGATGTFTAFGSAAGTPACNIYAEYANMGDARPQYTGEKSALVIRNEQPAAGVVTALANNVRLLPLAHEKTANVLVKSYLQLAGTSGIVNVASALSDTILEQTQIRNAGKLVRNNTRNASQKAAWRQMFETTLPQGYLGFSFIGSQTPRTAYRADDPKVVAPGADLALWSTINEAHATTVVNMVQEQIAAEVDDPYWLD